jgi:hypothetical protein
MEGLRNNNNKTQSRQPVSSLRFQPSTSGILVYRITGRPTLLAGRPSYNTVAKRVNFMEDSAFNTTYYPTREVMM